MSTIAAQTPVSASISWSTQGPVERHLRTPEWHPAQQAHTFKELHVFGGAEDTRLSGSRASVRAMLPGADRGGSVLLSEATPTVQRNAAALDDALRALSALDPMDVSRLNEGMVISHAVGSSSHAVGTIQVTVDGASYLGRMDRLTGALDDVAKAAGAVHAEVAPSALRSALNGIKGVARLVRA